ncbi:MULTISPECIES: hypothetical protein [Streptomyces]|uniref:hypothetical protein n=1 Tax=Streptomyces TaxID=1883 RepID=UPI002DD80B04|nr:MULTISPECIES: hypothetical protein [unclassified Streptomyces]WSE00925.1 hypothetical protein OG758_46315 [Streptomyces sp. NBC_01474]
MRARSNCGAEALEEHQRLSATIVTEGDIWRAAYATGIRTALERQRAAALDAGADRSLSTFVHGMAILTIPHD